MRNVAVVTGGTRGIGKAISLALHDKYHVIATYKSSDKAAELFHDAHGIEVHKLDSSDSQAVKNFTEEVQKRGLDIEVLVNNAGITSDKMLHRMEENQFDDVINNNLKSCFNMCRSIIPLMRARKSGKVINMSSVNALSGQMGQANYCASKAGIIGFTKALALENASLGITVNAIAPGYTNTDMVASIPPNVLEKIVSNIPLGRLAEPEEIAHAVSFLCAKKSSFITGTTISINGGQHLA